MMSLGFLSIIVLLPIVKNTVDMVFLAFVSEGMQQFGSLGLAMEFLFMRVFASYRIVLSLYRSIGSQSFPTKVILEVCNYHTKHFLLVGSHNNNPHN